MFSSRTYRAKRALTTAGKATIIVIIIVIVAVGGYFGVTQLTATHPPGKPITIAMTISQEGQYASLDAGYWYLNEAWQTYVNGHGGLVDANGVHHNVTIIQADDGSVVTTAVQEYKQFAELDGANIIVSPYSANTGLELLPVAQSDKVPLIMSEASTKSMWNGTYTWAVTPLVPYWETNTQNAWSASYFGLLNQTHWAHTIAFVGWNIAWAVDDYASGVWLANHTTGLNVIYQNLLAPGTTDFSGVVSGIKAADGGTQPDIIFCAIFGPVCASFITYAESQGLMPRQWHTIEWGAIFASTLQPTVSTANITTDVFWTPSFPSSYAGSSLYQTITNQADQLAVAANALPVTWYNYQNIEIRWEIYQMINASIAQIPTANFSSTATLDASINSALHHLNIQTITGPLQIQPLGYGTMGLVTVQFAKNGDINTVFPSSVANATYVHP
jgi:ABC-type branched-subunit amino acid transport system substrate-binding protein